MSREAHFSFVAVEYKRFLVDIGYLVTENTNFPRLCLIEVPEDGMEPLFIFLQGAAYLQQLCSRYFLVSGYCYLQHSV